MVQVGDHDAAVTALCAAPAMINSLTKIMEDTAKASALRRALVLVCLCVLACVCVCVCMYGCVDVDISQLVCCPHYHSIDIQRGDGVHSRGHRVCSDSGGEQLR